MVDIFIYFYSKILKKLRLYSLKKCSIHPTSKIESGSSLTYVKMDRHSFCGYNCDINNATIGSFVSIANNVVIGGGMHPMEWVSMSPAFYEGRDSIEKKYSTHKRREKKVTIIGHDVWIGEKAIIKQGVRIGTGSVIGMGSVVTKDVKPYSIVAGNPAKLIRDRFDAFTIQELLRSEWWNFSDDKLSHLAQFVTNPQLFLEMIKK